MSTTKQPEALTELHDYLRSLETDHSPDGWPAVRMRDITALLDDLDNARSDNQVLRLGYTAARLEIESLQRRVQEVGAAARREHERAAAPTAQPAPQQEAQEPMAWHEQARAIREGNEIAASDEYFAARPQIVSADRRKVFQAGFERGWDAARAAQEDKSCPKE
jgi:hypothetical protein